MHSQLPRFLIYFLLSSARARSHFLTDRDDLRQNACFDPLKDMPFGGLDNIRLHLGGQTLNPPKWAGIGISSPNRRSSKIAIYWSLMKVFASNFTNTLITGVLSKNAKLGQRGSGRAHVTYFWNLGPPPYLGNGWSLETSNLARIQTAITTKFKCVKRVRKGSRDLLFEFWNPPYLWNDWS